MTRNNLTTDGLEFVLPNGNAYTGPYHIHINKGAMVGAVHVAGAHDILTPVNDTVAERVVAVQSLLAAERLRENKIQSIQSQVTISTTSSGGSGGGSGGGGD